MVAEQTDDPTAGPRSFFAQAVEQAVERDDIVSAVYNVSRLDQGDAALGYPFPAKVDDAGEAEAAQGMGQVAVQVAERDDPMAVLGRPGFPHDTIARPTCRGRKRAERDRVEDAREDGRPDGRLEAERRVWLEEAVDGQQDERAEQSTPPVGRHPVCPCLRPRPRPRRTSTRP